MTTLGVMPAPVARAADITVNTLLDNESDGCSGGLCTLREATTGATAGQEIDFSVTGAITLASALPEITEDLTITQGYPDTELVAGYSGGGFYITTPADVTLRECAITHNTLPPHGALQPDPTGAGIYSDGDLTLERCTLSDNDADDNTGGGLYLFACESSITASTISGNSAAYSGGIYAVDVLMDVNSTTVTDNSASIDDGGLFAEEQTLRHKNRVQKRQFLAWAAPETGALSVLYRELANQYQL